MWLHVFTCISAFETFVRFSRWGLWVVQTEFPYAIHELSFNKQICSGNHDRTDATRLKKRPNSIHMGSQTSLWGALAASSRPKIQFAAPKGVQEWFLPVPIRHCGLQNGAKIYKKMYTKTVREKVSQNIQKWHNISSKSFPKMDLEIRGLRYARIAHFWRTSLTKC